MVRPATVSRPSRRDRRKEAEAAAALADERPVWARNSLPVRPAEPAEKKPGRVRRMVGALGDTWGRLPERLSRVSSAGPKTASFPPSANGNSANGHKANRPKAKDRQRSNGKASTHSWAGAGGKGSTSRPGGWAPSSLNAAGSRLVKK
jgi:hypothetical protein